MRLLKLELSSCEDCPNLRAFSVDCTWHAHCSKGVHIPNDGLDTVESDWTWAIPSECPLPDVAPTPEELGETPLFREV